MALRLRCESNEGGNARPFFFGRPRQIQALVELAQPIHEHCLARDVGVLRVKAHATPGA